MRPKKLLRALNRQAETGCMQIQNRPAAIFFHPDYTVGTGITPVQLALADFTAGRELHPALKNILFPSVLYRIMLYYSTIFYTFFTKHFTQNSFT